MLAVKEKRTDQVKGIYRVSRDKSDWDQVKEMWNRHRRNNDSGKAAVTILAWTYGDVYEVFQIKLHYAAGMITFREAMKRVRMVEGV